MIKATREVLKPLVGQTVLAVCVGYNGRFGKQVKLEIVSVRRAWCTVREVSSCWPIEVSIHDSRPNTVMVSKDHGEGYRIYPDPQVYHDECQRSDAIGKIEIATREWKSEGFRHVSTEDLVDFVAKLEPKENECSVKQ